MEDTSSPEGKIWDAGKLLFLNLIVEYNSTVWLENSLGCELHAYFVCVCSMKIKKKTIKGT